MEDLRAAMVSGQLLAAGIKDGRVLGAMGLVRREEFVPPGYWEEAYEPRSIPLGPGQTVSQPVVVAAMTQAAAPGPGDTVLEVGTGSGYQAAVLALLCASVVTIERDPALAASAAERLARLGYSNVEVILGDGSRGHPPLAPYAAILVTAAAEVPPPDLLSQLEEGGRMVIPLGAQGSADQELRVIRREGGRLTAETLFPVRFVPLVPGRAADEG